MSDPGKVIKNGKELRRGYTTGSCATAASCAAVEMLLSGSAVPGVKIMLPGGAEADFIIEDASWGAGRACCSVVKDAGDDPDVTDGLKIFAEVSKAQEGFALYGGEGIGTVMSPGLACPVGKPAINPVPRKMIEENIRSVCRKYSYSGGVSVWIFAPGGAEIARKTFNPRLGITGGISILGTTGIVEPMSERALIDTVKLLIDRQYCRDSENLLLTPGNYGVRFCTDELGMDAGICVKCSNYIGETLDYAVYKGFKRVLLVGHLGKLVKLAGGIMNTHSSVADCRLEILAAHGAALGASSQVVEEILECRTTDAVLPLLFREGLAERVFERLLERIGYHTGHRTGGVLQVEVVIFSMEHAFSVKSGGAGALITYFARGHQ